MTSASPRSNLSTVWRSREMRVLRARATTSTPSTARESQSGSLSGRIGAVSITT
ncbi:Uncharacterised protein [Mycobacteroides abscessus]|nr:Uncharacterised protein [Mycobacteroides abscessus]